MKFFVGLAILMSAGIYLFLRYRKFDLLPNEWLWVAGSAALFVITPLLIVFFTKGSRTTKSRDYGMQVELEAVEALMVVLPKNWRLCHSYPAPGGGDIDIVLTKKWLGVLALKKVAIEIKSWGGLYAKNGTLVKMSDGKPCYGNPAWQCYKNAKAIGAKPVLWLPVSKRSNAFEFSEYKIPSPILVVNGNASYLLKILG